MSFFWGFQGDWKVKNAFRLKWTDGHVWQQTCDVPVGEDIEFKVSVGKKLIYMIC